MCTSSEGDSSQEFLLFLFFFFLLYSCQRHETEKKHKASSVPTPELNFSGQFGEDFENSIWSLKLGNKTVTLLWDVRLSSSPKIPFEVSWKRSHNLPLNIEQIETKVLTRIFELAFILSHEHCWWALPPLSSTLWTSSCPLFFYLLPLFSPPPHVFFFVFFLSLGLFLSTPALPYLTCARPRSDNNTTEGDKESKHGRGSAVKRGITRKMVCFVKSSGYWFIDKPPPTGRE